MSLQSSSSRELVQQRPRNLNTLIKIQKLIVPFLNIYFSVRTKKLWNKKTTSWHYFSLFDVLQSKEFYQQLIKSVIELNGPEHTAQLPCIMFIGVLKLKNFIDL